MKILRVMDNADRKLLRIITDEGTVVLKGDDYKSVVTKTLTDKAEKALKAKE